MAKSSLEQPHRLIIEMAKAGKKEYCVIRKIKNVITYIVCVKVLWFWIPIQSFSDEDEEFALNESMELFNMITSKYRTK